MKIAFFDSGIGGLTVLKNAIHKLPYESFIYFADADHVPYGKKPREEVRGYVLEAVNFLAAKNIKALVVACNTATAVSIDELRSMHSFPIIGMEPAVKPAITGGGEKRILVTATSLTLKEQKLETLITTYDKKGYVDKLPLDGLVKYAESFMFDSGEAENYIKQELSRFTLDQYEAIVLGCTHFIFFEKMFRNIIGQHINLIHGNEGTVRHLIDQLQKCNRLQQSGKQTIDFYSSSKPEAKDRCEIFLKYLTLP